MGEHDFINAAIRRQIVEATYNAPLAEPVVNICGSLDGQKIQVFGEDVAEYPNIKLASAAYYAARATAWAALDLLNNTLARKDGQ